MTNGWIDKEKSTIINFLVNNPKGIVFIKSIDATAISKTTREVFEMKDKTLLKRSEKTMPLKLTDNATNYNSAGQMLMGMRKMLFWTPCVTHCVDLMLEDYEKISIYEETIPKGKKLLPLYLCKNSSNFPMSTFN